MLNPARIRAWNLLAAAWLAVGAAPLWAGVVDFEDLIPTEPFAGLGGGAYWRGPDEHGVEEIGPWGDTLVVGNFVSGGVQFVNRYGLSAGYVFWSGFGYSNTTDTSTPGFGNQYSAFAGGGAHGSRTYAVGAGYVDVEDLGALGEEDLANLPSLSLPMGTYVTRAWVTNTTYVALSLRDGDSFAKKFGGDSGEDPDWFKITAFGYDAAGTLLPEQAEFYLADYRASESGEDFIVKDWTQWDLSALKAAQRIYFNFSSSDRGAWGMNTPALFALDDLQFGVVPEPPSGWLLAIGLLVTVPPLVRFQRRRRGGAQRCPGV